MLSTNHTFHTMQLISVTVSTTTHIINCNFESPVPQMLHANPVHVF